MEHWQFIDGFKEQYEISSLGRVRSLKRYGGTNSRILRPVVGAQGYRWVTLCSPGQRPRNVKVHQLVLNAFVGPRPDGMGGLHKDDDPANNALSNLRWGSQTDNQNDRVENGGHAGIRKSHCPQNHPYYGDNLYQFPDGRRGCRACAKAANQRHRERKRQAVITSKTWNSTRQRVKMPSSVSSGRSWVTTMSGPSPA